MWKEIIVTFIFNFVCIFNLVWIYSIVTEKSLKLKIKYIMLMILCTCINVSLFYLNVTFLKTIISLLSMVVLNKIIFKDKLSITVIYTLFNWLIGMLLDLVFMSGFSYINKKYLSLFFRKYEFYIICLSSLLLQMFHNLLSRLKPIKKLLKKIYNVLEKINIDYLIILFMIIIFVILGSTAVNNIYDLNYVINIMIFAILLFIIFILFFSKKYQMSHLNATIQLLLENNKFYSNLNVDFRKFKHNLIHKLDGLKLYSNEKSILLINDIILECYNIVNGSKEIDKLPMSLGGFIYQKIYNYEYDTLNLLVENSINRDLLEILKPKNFNKLCEMLGVILDNSIQASLISDDKILYIVTSETEKYIEITIKNSFSSLLDIDQIGNLNYSTNGESHGLGLFSILKNKDVKTKIRIVNNLFESTLIIKKHKKTLNDEI